MLITDIDAELTTEGPTVTAASNIATTTANKGVLLMAVRGFGTPCITHIVNYS